VILLEATSALYILYRLTCCNEYDGVSHWACNLKGPGRSCMRRFCCISLDQVGNGSEAGNAGYSVLKTYVHPADVFQIFTWSSS